MRKLKQFGPKTLIFLGLLQFTLAVFVFVNGVGSEFPRTVASRNWPLAEGEIVDVGVRKRNLGSVRYLPTVNYTYRVENERHRGDRLNFNTDNDSSDEESAAEMIEDYNPGDKVDIAYNPENVKESVLEPGIPGFTYFMIFLSAYFSWRGYRCLSLVKQARASVRKS